MRNSRITKFTQMKNKPFFFLEDFQFLEESKKAFFWQGKWSEYQTQTWRENFPLLSLTFLFLSNSLRNDLWAFFRGWKKNSSLFSWKRDYLNWTILAWNLWTRISFPRRSEKEFFFLENFWFLKSQERKKYPANSFENSFFDETLKVQWSPSKPYRENIEPIFSHKFPIKSIK